MKRNLKTLALASTAALFAASGARAGQVEITNVGVQSYETTDLSGTINGSTLSASPITTLIELTTTAANILPVFCVDLFHDINIGSYSPPLPYTLARVSTDSTGAEPGEGNSLPNPPVPGEIQALANLGAADYEGGVTNADVYTAIAAAIWYIEYNTNGNSLSVTGDGAVGSATAGDPGGATGLIATDLAYAAANATDYSIGLYPTEGAGFTGYGQGFVQGVPEPSTWAMMIVGFAGLAFAGYRRAKAKTVIA